MTHNEEKEINNPFALDNDEPAKEVETPLTEDSSETKKPTVKKSAEKVADRAQQIIDENYHFETEEDGDIFWLVQKTVWGIAKSLLVIGIIFVLIWVIWGDIGEFKMSEVSLPEISMPEKPITKKPTPKAQPVPQTEIRPEYYEAIAATKWNFWLFNKYRGEIHDQISLATVWMYDTENLFQTPFLTQIKADTRQGRTRKIAILLRKIESLLKRSQKIRGFFEQELATLRAESLNQDAAALAKENRFLEQFNQRRGSQLSDLLTEKVAAGNAKFSADNQIWVRELFLEKITAYEASLKNVKNIILTNKEALIEDIQVVQFPADPFERVLQPQ